MKGPVPMLQKKQNHEDHIRGKDSIIDMNQYSSEYQVHYFLLVVFFAFFTGAFFFAFAMVFSPPFCKGINWTANEYETGQTESMIATGLPNYNIRSRTGLNTPGAFKPPAVPLMGLQ